MTRALSGPERAAVVIAALGPTWAAPVVRRLPEGDLLRLLRVLVRGVTVDDTMQAAILAAVGQQVGRRTRTALGGWAFVRTLLIQAFGEAAADTWLRRLQGDDNERPFAAWAQSRPEDVARLLADEHPQSVAVVLSHLPPELAAGVLQQWPPTQRAEVVRRIARLAPVPRRVLAVLEARLTQKAVEQGSGPRHPRGVDVLVGMFNQMRHETGRTILEALTEKDPPLAETIKARMFLFEDLANLTPRILQEVLRRLNKKDLALALRLVHPENQAIFFANMGREAAEEVRAEMIETGPVPVREAEAAQHRLVAAIRAMEEASEIELVRGTEELV
ncbi:MAG: hypothetical protein K6V97_09495 [Actinomycetia bacterium]|nr:hypothetical protein [Actinomycetes bacterium]